MKRSIPVYSAIPKPQFKRQKLEPPKPTKSQLARNAKIKNETNTENQQAVPIPTKKPITNTQKPLSTRKPVAASKPVPAPVSKKPAPVSTIKSFRTNPTLTTKDQLQATKSKILELQLENQSLNESVAEFESQIQSHLQEITNLSILRQKSNDTLKAKNNEIALLNSQIQETQSKLDQFEITNLHQEAEITNNKSKIQLLTTSLKQSQSHLLQVQSELGPLQQQHTLLQSQFNQQSTDLTQFKQMLEISQTSLSTTQSQLQLLESKHLLLQSQYNKQSTDLQEMTVSRDFHKLREIAFESQLLESEKLKRFLHNQVMELKGNIRVFCRVRPFLKSELTSVDKTPNKPQSQMDCQSSNSLIFKEPEVSHDGQSRFKEHFFQYDMVFNQKSTQKEVFDEIQQLVQSAMDGYNVCIFAYGVTSSGKTYTMQGPEVPTNETVGMIPRAIDLIFDQVPLLESKQWSFTLEVMYVEIYNEQINDLIGAYNDRKTDKKPDVRLLKNSTEIINCNKVAVTNRQQVHKLIKFATKTRSVGATNCNERSSRSHSVFVLLINGVNKSSGEEIHGSLNLVDLAGSERLQSSKSEGVRLKETQNINKSLAALGDVIMALGKQDNHVPYRNSKVNS